MAISVIMSLIAPTIDCIVEHETVYGRVPNDSNFELQKWIVDTLLNFFDDYNITYFNNQYDEPNCDNFLEQHYIDYKNNDDEKDNDDNNDDFKYNDDNFRYNNYNNDDDNNDDDNNNDNSGYDFINGKETRFPFQVSYITTGGDIEYVTEDFIRIILDNWKIALNDEELDY